MKKALLSILLMLPCISISTFAINWDNTNFLDETFWSQNPTNEDIITALYWDGNVWNDKTAYTMNWTGVICNTGNMQVVYLDPGINTIPFTLNNNTIYVLNEWSYITTGSITLNNCSALIGKWTGSLFSIDQISQIIYANNIKNSIVENILVNWSLDWLWWIHSKNNNGIYLVKFYNSTINNVEIKENTYGIRFNQLFTSFVNKVNSYDNSQYWVDVSYSMNNYFNNIDVARNTICWFNLLYSDNNKVYKSKVYYGGQRGLELAWSSNNTIDQVEIYNNVQGLLVRFSSNYNKITNTKIYKNSYGVWINSSFYNVFKNIEIYNNITFWISILDSSSNNLTNMKVFNNTWWLIVQNNSNNNVISNTSIFNDKENGVTFTGESSSSNPKNNTIVNNLIFNNKKQWIRIEKYTSGNIIQNVNIYNNGSYGIYLENHDSIKNNIFSNAYVYNNTTWIYIPVLVTGNYVYNDLSIFSNKNENVEWLRENLIIWSGNSFTSLWWNIGKISTEWIMSWSVIANPLNKYWSYLLSWMNTNRNDMIGIKTFSETHDIKISYWYNIPRQEKPVIYSWISPILSWEYNENKYIGGDVLSFTWYLSTRNNHWTNSFFDVFVFSSWVYHNIFWDVYSIYSGISNTLQSIVFSPWTGTKTIITQLYDTNSFATHIVNNSIYFPRNYVEIPNTSDINIIRNEFLNDGYQESIGSIVWSLSGYFIGRKKLDFQYSLGKLPAPVVLQSLDTKAEVEISSWIILKTNKGKNYTGIFEIPTYISTGSIPLSWVISAISVWSNTTSLQIKDVLNNNVSAVIRISTPGIASWIPVNIYYSQDNGITRNYQTTTTTLILSWLSYVEFTTMHFTDFAITLDWTQVYGTGTFVINNDDNYTVSQNVTLNTTIPFAISGMKFSNDGTGNRSNWESYSPTKSRVLSSGLWLKTVYVAFDYTGDGIIDSTINDVINYVSSIPLNEQGQLSIQILGWITECVYGTSLNMNSQELKIGIPYTFTGTFPLTWYCQDYRGIDWGWTFTIQTTDLYNEQNNIISGSNLLIFHDPVTVEWDLACTGHDGTVTQFYSNPYEIFEKIEGSNKICKVSANNVSLLVNVPANQAPGNYSGTLTLTMNGF